MFWSEALGGLPYRGTHAPIMKQEDLENIEVAWDWKFDTFDLSIQEHQDRYQYVMDRAVNKWFYIHHIERHWLPETKTMIVYVEWSQRYGELSPTAKAAMRSRSYGPPVPTPVVPPIRTNPPLPPLAGFQPGGNGFD